VRRDPRLIAVPVVLAIVATTWIAAATLPSPKGAVATRSSVVAVRQATLVCPQAGGPTASGGLTQIAYADSRVVEGGPASSSLTPAALSSAPVSSSPATRIASVPSASASSASASSASASKAAVGVAPVKSASATSAPASSALVSSAPASPAPATSSAPAVANSDGSVLTAGVLGPQYAPEPITLQPGHAWTVHGPTEQTAIELGVSGPIAQSLGAVQFTRTVVGSVPQLALAPCEGPTTDAWFAGFSSQAGTHATLYLSNVDLVPATLDVSVWGNLGGAVDTKRGIRVDPQTQVTISLDEFAPGLTAGVAHILASSGRVVPAVRYEAANGSIPVGTDWLPRTAAPATTQTVPGLVAGDGTRQIVVADPGPLDASFSVTVITIDGSFTPTDFAAQTVQSGGVTEINVDPVLQQAAAAIVINSTEPVVAGGISTLPLDPTGATDVAFTAAVPPLSGSVVVPGGEVSDTQHTVLLLTAPDGDAQLTVTVLPTAPLDPSLPTPAPSTFPMTIADSMTSSVDLTDLTSDPAPAVVITPGSGGAVYAAWVVQEDGPSTDVTGDVSEIALSAPVRALVRPTVMFDPAVGVR